MREELVIIPFVFMFAISMFIIVYDESGELGSGYVIANPANEPYLYDYTGRPIFVVANMSNIAENAIVNEFKNINPYDNIPDNVYYVLYINDTWYNPRIGYYLYYTSEGNSSLTWEVPVTWQDFQEMRQAVTRSTVLDVTADFNSSYGLIALVISMIVGVAIIGLNIAGTGINTASTTFIITSVGLVAVWVVFSVISLNGLSQIPLGIGSIFYFGCTGSYCMGIILNSKGG